ncbi:hypothetical protein GCM10025876_39320 [Demequina litorisediminis]|uniref:alanine--tRNA ligase n=1 Tax=Demequina litorisediminis TaxID=1849022 RepID=A0ABQ6IM24_9MICO|nr:hypothetical protein GCM10025876_39320 [Demequina litorisediminis]
MTRSSSLLEMRLDALVLRAGFGRTILQARQAVLHRHILVDGQIVDRPSFRVKPGQTIQVKPKAVTMEPYMAAAAGAHRDVLPEVPDYLDVTLEKPDRRLVRRPERAEVPVTCEVQARRRVLRPLSERSTSKTHFAAGSRSFRAQRLCHTWDLTPGIGHMADASLTRARPPAPPRRRTEMRTADIRQRWIDYFESKDHHIEPSASLVSPDPSLLFTVAGMVPFIPYIIGTETSPHPRIASVQKCIRTKDIEEVGKTTRHGTFFQMLGNFSFGDYFKEGAIDFAWDLLTGPESEGKYGFDPERFWVTIWNEDDEAFSALTNVGVDPEHIVRLTREEIFWDTGQPGPAGPCAEWHYDRGPEFGPDAVGGIVDPGGDRYLEIWNLVFDQYLRGEGSGKDYPLIRELDQKAIDTGAGLERIAYLKQGVGNMYEIDEVFPVIARTQEPFGPSVQGQRGRRRPHARGRGPRALVDDAHSRWCRPRQRGPRLRAASPDSSHRPLAAPHGRRGPRDRVAGAHLV